jgi:hypothetical protein
VKWQYKAVLQQIFSHLPGGERLNFFFQKHVTGGCPRPDNEVAQNGGWARAHVDAAQRFGKTDFATARFFEFGAGMDLLGPLLFYSLGIERQLVVDLRRLMRVQLVNHSIDQVRRFAAELGVRRQPERYLTGPDPARTLIESYGIEYRAPLDARATGLPAGSVDHVTSTNTLEHVGPSEIAAIHRECFRLLKPNGLATHQIDYQDHYSYFDRGISAFNYLRYSDREWSRYNPSLMYQNRLRHRDHLELIRGAGFEILEEQLREGTTEDCAIVRALPLAQRFRIYPTEQLAIRTALVVARKTP